MYQNLYNEKIKAGKLSGRLSRFTFTRFIAIMEPFKTREKGNWRMNILVSACLMGVECRYNGEGVLRPEIKRLMEHHHLIPVCPEQLGGLSTPRCPAERLGERVITKEGLDVTKEYRRGADETLKLARLFHCKTAVLKERSPSCGCGRIYDGSFSGKLTDGDGVTAGVLKAAGVTVVGESRCEELLSYRFRQNVEGR